MDSNPLPQPYADDEIDLLDLLVTVAENIKLLVLGPLVVGLVALGVAFQKPQIFESTAVVNAEAGGYNSNLLVAMSQSAPVLQVVRQATNFAPESSPEQAIRQLRGSINASIGRQDKLVTLTVTRDSAASAQTILQALLQELFVRSQSRGAALERLQARIDQEQQSYQAAVLLEQELLPLIQSGKATEATANAYASLVSSNAAKFVSIQSLQARLLGLTEDEILQPPSLPEGASKSNKSLIAVVAALASGFALLLFVFVRQAFRNAGANPESAAKLARIRQAFGLR